MSGPVEIARAGWDGAPPEWVEAMARACEETSQSRVAARMGRSPALVSQVLRGKYLGNLVAVEEAFNGAFRAATIECPRLGLIAPRICETWRRRARSFANIGPNYTTMFRACQACPRFKKGADE